MPCPIYSIFNFSSIGGRKIYGLCFKFDVPYYCSSNKSNVALTNHNQQYLVKNHPKNCTSSAISSSCTLVVPWYYIEVVCAETHVRQKVVEKKSSRTT